MTMGRIRQIRFFGIFASALLFGIAVGGFGFLRGAVAQVLPIECEKAERTWPTILPNGDHSKVAEFYVTGNCLCRNTDPSGSFNNLARLLLEGAGPGQQAFLMKAAEAIYDYGGFTPDGKTINPALGAWLNLEKELHLKVDPADDSEAETKVYCVTISDLAGWAGGMRPFAGNWENSFPRNQ